MTVLSFRWMEQKLDSGAFCILALLSSAPLSSGKRVQLAEAIQESHLAAIRESSEVSLKCVLITFSKQKTASHTHTL